MNPDGSMLKGSKCKNLPAGAACHTDDQRVGSLPISKMTAYGVRARRQIVVVRISGEPVHGYRFRASMRFRKISASRT
jgi:hypothetical protein